MTDKIEFTGKVGARSMSFLIDDNSSELHTAWYTLLETKDGQKLTVKDSSSIVGMMEGETRYRAIKKGKEVLKRLENK